MNETSLQVMKSCKTRTSHGRPGHCHCFLFTLSLTLDTATLHGVVEQLQDFVPNTMELSDEPLLTDIHNPKPPLNLN